MTTDAERSAFKLSELHRIADLHPGVTELLAAERRATVERIRTRLLDPELVFYGPGERNITVWAEDIQRILDEEADR